MVAPKMRKKKIRLGGSPLTKIVLQGVFTGLVLKVLSMELVPPNKKALCISGFSIFLFLALLSGLYSQFVEPFVWEKTAM